MNAKLNIISFIAAFVFQSQAMGMELRPGKYNIDPAHTRVAFSIAHFVISEVQGRFNEVEGTFTLSKDLSSCAFDVKIPIQSIDTGVEKRDQHLLSDDFFDAEKYPTMTFKANECSGTLEEFKIKGDLTIKDVTKPVTFNARYTGTVKDSWENIRTGLRLSSHIDRKEFNIKYHDVVEAGPVVGDDVIINIVAQGTLDSK